MDTLDMIISKSISHHGIRGMKWGVRRRRGKGGTVGSAHPPSSTSEDAKKAQQSHATVKKHGSTDPLSNQELQHLVGRINLEQQYVRLTTPKKNAGAKFAKEILIGVGKNQVTKLASDAAAKAVSAAIKK